MSHAKLPLLALFALTLTGCATKPPPEPFAVSNLKYGKMCDPPEMRVCMETSDIVVDGKGRCVYDHKEIACTWYGFPFDYAPKDRIVRIDCGMSTDHKREVGNPDGIVAKDTKGQDFEIEIGGGHFVNPQYTAYAQLGRVDHLTEVCSYQGRKLFEFTLNLRYEGAAS